MHRRTARSHRLPGWLPLLLVALVLVGLGGCGGSPAAVRPESTLPADSDSEADVLLSAGKAALERGDSVRAEQYLTLALRKGKESEQVVPLLLHVCLTNSRLRAALDHAEPFLLEHPEQDALRYLVATIHLSLGQREEARLELQQILHRSPTFADALYLMGILHFTEEPTTARDYFHEYLSVAPRGTHAAEVRSRLVQIAIRESNPPSLAVVESGAGAPRIEDGGRQP